MKPIILTGIIQKFSSHNNGRIYSKEIYEREIRRYEEELKKRERIKKLKKILKYDQLFRIW